MLEKLKIENKLYLSKRKGLTDSIMLGRPITRTMDLYSLSITKKSSVKKFSDLINFSIIRKYQKLTYGVWIVNNFVPNLRLKVWKKKYKKIRKYWRLINISN